MSIVELKALPLFSSLNLETFHYCLELEMINPVIPGPLQSKIGSGGFGVVYRDPRNSMQRCIKKYGDPLREQSAERIVHLANIDKWARPSDASLLKENFAWPLECFGDLEEIIAFTMDIAPEDFQFELRMRNGKQSKKLLQLDFLIDNRFFSSNAIDSTSEVIFSTQDRLELLLSICNSVLTLHQYGLVYQDISSKNIVANKKYPHKCLFLDADSITTIDDAAQSPISSPTWDVPHGLGPLEIDRSRLALLVFRVLVRGHNSRPETDSQRLSDLGLNNLAWRIEDAYRTGDLASTLHMYHELQIALDETRQYTSFLRALERGFAREIYRSQVYARSITNKHLVNEALDQIKEESALEQTDFRSQRRNLMSLQKRNKFYIDLLPGIGIMPKPKTLSELHDLAFNSCFLDIAQHFTRTGLGSIELDRTMKSIIDRAIFESSKGEIFTSSGPGYSDLTVRWPAEHFINTAEVKLFLGGVQQSLEVLRRAPSEREFKRKIRAESGGTIAVEVRFGSTSTNDVSYFCFNPTLTSETSIPPRQVPSSTSTRATQPINVDLFDPIEEARKAEIVRLLNRQRLKRKILIGTALIGVTVGAVLFFTKPSGPPPPTFFDDGLRWFPRDPYTEWNSKTIELPKGQWFPRDPNTTWDTP
jgi:hypothetical protein